MIENAAGITGIKKHYHWVVAVCCFLTLFVDIGMPSTSFSVYQSYIVELPGVGHFGGSVVLAVRTFASLIAMFLVAQYYRKLNCRLGVLIAMIVVAVGFGVYSQANGLVPLCVGAFITGVGYGLGGMVASTMLIRRWFNAKVGTVAGFAAVGTGVCAMIIPPAAVAIIEATSLSFAFAAEGVLALVIGLIVFALLRNYPLEMGLEPYGGAEETASGKGGRTRIHRDMPHKFVPFVFVIMMFVGAISIVGAGYVGVLFTSEGFSNQDAAALIVVFSASLTVAKLFNGIVFDKLGTRNGSALFFAILAVGLALMCATDMGATSLAVVACVLAGVGTALGTVGISVWSIELAPKGREVQTIKNFQIGYVLGGFAFNFVPGALMELLGTYLVSYELMFAMAVFSGVGLFALYVHLDARAKRGKAA